MTPYAAAPASTVRVHRFAVAAFGGALCLSMLTAPSAYAVGPTCFGAQPTIVGTDESELLLGTPGPDIIVGLAGADDIQGRGGDDLICADQDGSDLDPLAPDRLRGGSGDDALLGVLAAEPTAPTISSGDAGDDSMVATTVTYAASPHRVSVRLDVGIARGWGHDAFTSVTHVIGSSFGDVLVGNDVPLDDEGMCGELGCDQLEGGAGPDELDGLAGFDLLIGGGGDDRLFGGRGSDTLQPGPGEDVVRGGAGLADTLDYSHSGHAVVVDLTDGIATGQGRDSIASLDRVSGSRFGDTINGDERANTLAGYDGPDVIRGRAGDDVLFGSSGRDELYGGVGHDSAVGGFGSDRCAAEERLSCES